MSDPDGFRAAVVGLGLMGGSVAGALRGRCRSVTGVDRRRAAVETALARRLIDSGTTDLAEGVRDANVVILAAPVRQILHLIGQVGRLAPPGCLLIDLGSTKVQIMEEMARLPGHIQPVGGHPMCGSEKSGIAAADPALFKGHLFILTRLARTTDGALAAAHRLVEMTGAHPLMIEASEHDHLVAVVSHLPYLLACGLVSAAEKDALSDDGLRWQVAASGFRDTSRLAASDVTMMLDILLTNRLPVLQALRNCQQELGALAGLLEAGDEAGLQSALISIAERRNSLFQ